MRRQGCGDGSRLQGALVGCGNVAIRAHLPIWQKSSRFRIIGVLESSPERAQLATELLPDARIYPDLECLLADRDLDFVDICTPPCFHAELTLAACRSGLHVFCEKPLVTSVASLAQIRQAAAESQSVVFSVNNWKHAPLWRKAIELIEAEKIGKVRSISLTVLRTPKSGGGATDWRRCLDIAGGGILLDHGWHHFYLILAIVKELPCSLWASMEFADGDNSGLEETVNVILRFRSAQARLHLTWRATARHNYGTITGERGTLYLNDDHLILSTDKGYLHRRYDFSEPLSAGSHHLQWMKPVIEDFHREILDAAARGSSLQEATWCAQLTDLAYRSQREHSRSVQVCDLAM